MHLTNVGTDKTADEKTAIRKERAGQKNMEKDDIKKLVLQAAQGNKAAFGALYEETGRTVYFSCLKLLGDPQLAEDITQETYLTALQSLALLHSLRIFQHG